MSPRATSLVAKLNLLPFFDRLDGWPHSQHRPYRDGEAFSEPDDWPAGRFAAFQSIAMRIRARPLG